MADRKPWREDVEFLATQLYDVKERVKALEAELERAKEALETRRLACTHRFDSDGICMYCNNAMD